MHHNQSRLDDQYTRMHGTPYVMRRRIIRSGTGLNLPCTKPPWGALVAIDLKTGARAWDVPLGDPAGMRPEFAAVSKTPLGTPNLGGPIVTAGGIAFIGATMDHALRAFDVETGRELWKGTLPGGARATPMTYEVGRPTVRHDLGRRQRRLGQGRLRRDVCAAEIASSRATYCVIPSEARDLQVSPSTDLSLRSRQLARLVCQARRNSQPHNNFPRFAWPRTPLDPPS